MAVEKTAAGVNRVFTLLGLGEISGDRLERIINDDRSYTQIRDDLLEWGQGQGGDTYENQISSLVKNYFDQAGLSADDARIARITGEITSGDRQLDEVRSTIEGLGEGDGTGQPGGAPAEAVAPPLPGGETIRVGDRWYQVYEFPAGSGQFVSYQFNDRAQADQALGADFGFSVRSDTWFSTNVLAEGAFEEVAGLEGNWAGYMDQVMREAAQAAGVRDPGLIGRIASDPEMQAIMAQAVVGDWTPAQIKAEQRNTNFWKNELYPGIENLYGRTQNPEQAYESYRNQVAPYLAELGYDAGADGLFKDSVQRMLDGKIDSNVFITQVPTFIRATQNPEFAAVLNQWAERDLGRSVDFNDWFDLMEGEAAPELNDIAERASLQWAADNQGSTISQSQIEDIASRSQLSEAEARAAFSEFNQSVLALGEEGLSKYGLNRDEVLSVAAGVAPTSGRSIDEVKLLVAKTAREQGAADDEKINLYVGFDALGRPTRPGLGSLRPESG